jgi:hypothetical protein
MELVFKASLNLKFSSSISEFLTKFRSKEFGFASVTGVNGTLNIENIIEVSSKEIKCTVLIQTENKKMYDSFESYLNCVNTIVSDVTNLSVDLKDIRDVIFRTPSALDRVETNGRYQIMEDSDKTFYVTLSNGTILSHHQSLEIARQFILDRQGI